MSKIKNVIAYAKNLAREPEAWSLAFREKAGGSLPDGEPTGQDIRISLSKPSAIRFSGIHTYNCSESYEIIDMPYYGEPNRVVFRKKRKKFIRYLQKKL